MPYIHRKPDPAEYPELVEAIVSELRLDREEGPTTAPEIIEEEFRGSPFRHVTVVWDRWESLSRETRGRIILDAYEKCFGEGAGKNISLALGLTRSDAEHLGTHR